MLQALRSIPEPHRVRLEATLRGINSRKIEQREYWMEAPLRASYDAAAQVFADSGESLSEETLISRIPVLLFEVALEFRWVTLEEAERSSFCWSHPVRYGKPLVFPDPAASLGICLGM